MKINILLTNNFFHYHTSYCFVYPIIKSMNLIKKSGIKVNFIYSIKKKIFDCNILIIESRFLEQIKKKNYFINYLKKNKSKNKKLKLIFADTADNSGQIQREFLTFADTYWKGQIIKDKKKYLKAHYGGRLFTDFYKKKFNIKDKKIQLSNPIKNINLLKKIKICWNMGLCDHGNFTHIKQKLFSIFKSKFFINNSNNFSSPSIKRKLNLSCRIGLNYQRETVQFQREKISKLLKKYVETTKISRFKYLNEIKNSKYIISPFGWGEICPRDFEIFMNGGILIKPDMKTIDTWPNWYISEKTYLPFNWDLKDFNKKIEFALNNYKKLKKIAINAQKNYFIYTTGKKSKEIFAKRFIKLIKN